jgi:hypothetical protein
MPEKNLRIGLKPSDAKIAAKALMRARKPFCFVGKPGGGKTSIGHQAAHEIDFDVITSNPSMEDMSEPGGIPWFAHDHSHAEKLLFGQAWKVVNATKNTLWWLEDFGGAAESVQKAYMQWIEAREVDGKRLPDCVTIGMATNERGQRSGVSGILETIKGRVTMIKVDTDVEDFCSNLFERGESEYGLDEEAILNGVLFIRNNPDRLNAFDPTADMTNSPTERNWTNAFGHTMFDVPRHVCLKLVEGRVGEGDAVKFMAFLAQLKMQKAFSLDAILANPGKAAIPDNTSAQWAVAVGLGAKANEICISQIKVYVERMEAQGLGEFATLCVQKATAKCPGIANTLAYTQMMQGPIGKLIQGKVAA